ncbi:MAG: nicotinamide riboside transporter PnuC [Lachnospirales bacterium]
MNIIIKVKKNIYNSFSTLNTFERSLWAVSVIGVMFSFLISQEQSYLVLFSSLIGVTSLIFLAKGNVLGNIICIIFCLLYGYISYRNRLFGEMITYLFMTMPICIMSTISWLKNPFNDGKTDSNVSEVEIADISKNALVKLLLTSVMVTWIFYYILDFFNTPFLIVSTLSITTSFLAASLAALRSPYYALIYALNDIVLISIWTFSTMQNPENLSMVICFAMFLLNDLYGYVNWLKIKKRQTITK